MEKCKWEQDEVCVNADCPLCADFCPVIDTPGVCKHEERRQAEQKDSLCYTCKHAVDGCVDDFATCYCPHHEYVGQKTECKEYETKEVSDNG